MIPENTHEGINSRYFLFILSFCLGRSISICK